MAGLKSPRLAPRVADRATQDVLQRILDDIYALNSMAGKFFTVSRKMKTGEPEDFSTDTNLVGAFPVAQVSSIDWHSVEIKRDGSLRITAEFEDGPQTITWVLVRA